MAQIAASIKEFSFTNPILIDESSQIIAGHGRLLAARKLEMPDVPCIRLSHLTKSQKKALVIADNKLSLNAGWDNDMLALELGDLKIDGFDLDLTGFNADELAALEALGDSLAEDGTTQSAGDEDEKKTLSDRFLVPPFSVLDARQGYWQERKRQWLAMGIKSELGRGGGATYGDHEWQQRKLGKIQAPHQK